MSALVLTVLICLAWAGMAALGYLRGGWREVVTLAAILLAYAVASEWAGPNGRDLAGLFGGNTYRSATTIGLAYLFGGVALFGYFGGSRLPRPIPLSATERFVGGAVGLLNGGLLAALALRIVRSSAFGPGDGRVLQDATLARVLVEDIGYLLLVGLIAAVIAPFLSSLLVRQPPYAAEYAEDPALQNPPAFGYTPDYAAAGPQAPPTMYTAPYAPMNAPPMAAQSPPVTDAPPGSLSTFVSPPPPPAAPLIVPTAPMLPRAVPAPMWPTPSLPVSAATANGTDDVPVFPASETPAPAPGNAPTEAERAVARPGPPGVAITASQPLPLTNETPGDTSDGTSLPPPATPRPAIPPLIAPPVTLVPSTPSGPPALPAFTTGPAPFTATGTPNTRPAGANGEASAASPTPAPLPVAETIPTDITHAVTHPIAPESPRDLIPTAPTLPRMPLMPALIPPFAQAAGTATPQAVAADAPLTPAASIAPDATSPTGRARVARARVAPARASEPPAAATPNTAPPPALQRPVQPGPNMHPCPVCDYPVRNGARFCPNCGSVQPPA